mmetsp:Transcript_33906/g.24952  ORF Transcript_33906/g.24952 Transcript_33906/m.24952 type:complete len:154 (+) Transcript_33906:289-750(+)
MIAAEGPFYSMGLKTSLDKKDQDGLGPGAYFPKAQKTAPTFAFGVKFDSDIRSKDHIHPRKKDGPGPGSYDMGSTLKIASKSEKGKQETTWGKAQRDWSSLPKGLPGPNQYRPEKFTEASHQYSFPKASRTDEAAVYKASIAPGPGAYNVASR